MSWKLIAFAPRAVIEAARWRMRTRLTGIRRSSCQAAKSPRTSLRGLAARSLAGTQAGQGRQGRDCRAVSGQGPQADRGKAADIDWLTHSSRGWSRSAPAVSMSTRRNIRRWPSRACAPPFRQPGLGTGQHATTAGCLEMLDAMKRRGLVVTAPISAPGPACIDAPVATSPRHGERYRRGLRRRGAGQRAQ